jgi:hypothetical protein
LQDATGSIAAATNPALGADDTRNIVLNSDFSSDTIWNKGAGWTIAGGVAVASAANSFLRQDGILEDGKDYRTTYTQLNRSAGTSTMYLQGNTGAAQSTNDTFIQDLTAGSANAIFGLNSSALTAHIDNITAHQRNIPANAPDFDGTNTGMAIAQTTHAAGNIPLLYSGNGTTSRITWSTITEYNSFCNSANGSKIIFAQSDTWAAGVDVLWRSAVDDNNEIIIYRDGTNLKVEYVEAGNSSLITIPSGSPSGLFSIGMSWDVAGVGLSGFYNGVKSGSSVAIATVMIGNLDITKTALFANDNAGANSWAGDGAYAGLSNVAEPDSFFSTLHNGSGI